MTTEEIKTLINNTLADVGNQAPWGGALNKILNGLVDLSSNQTNILDLSNVVIGETRGMTVKGTMENIANTLNITKEEVDNLFHGKYTQICPRWEQDGNIHYVIHCFLNEVSEEYSDSGREIRAVEYYDGVHYFRVQMDRIKSMEDDYVFSISQDMG